VPVIAANYGRQLIGTFHERFGEQRLPVAEGDADPDWALRGAWGRLIGVSGQYGGDPRGIYGGSPAFDYTFGALQAGLDLYAREYANGHRDIAGVYLAIGRGEADVEHNLNSLATFKAGEDSFDAVSVGGYWTRIGANDWYLDGVVQATWYDFEMDSQRGLPTAETDAFGFATSLEGGYPFDLGNGWRLEPQAQLVYQMIDVSDFNDGAADIRFSDTDSLAGRIGARLARSWSVGDQDYGEGNGGGAPTRHFTLWGRADLWHEFLGEPTTKFSSAAGFIPFTANLGDDWVEFGIGGDFDMTHDIKLFGNVTYETALDGDSHAWEGKLGLKIKW
jgi:outer membrane autotransporter protein